MEFTRDKYHIIGESHASRELPVSAGVVYGFFCQGGCLEGLEGQGYP